jgi:hypothetical protein
MFRCKQNVYVLLQLISAWDSLEKDLFAALASSGHRNFQFETL